MQSLRVPLATMAAALSLASPLLHAKPIKTASPSVISYKVLKGETLWSISQRHQSSVGEIMELNKLDSPNVREGMTLKIAPRGSKVAVSTPAKSVAPKTEKTVKVVAKGSSYQVKDGETFWSIAEKHGINAQALEDANPTISPNRLRANMSIVLPQGAKLVEVVKPKSIEKSEVKDIAKNTPSPTETANPTKPVQVTLSGNSHTLAAGETFYSLAKVYGVKMSDLIAVNPDLKPERLALGTKIQLPSNAVTKPVETPKTTLVTKSTEKTVPTIEADSTEVSAAPAPAVPTVQKIPQNIIEQTLAHVSNAWSEPLPADITTESEAAAGGINPTVLAIQAPPTAPVRRMDPIEVAEDGSIRSYIVSNGETAQSICEAFGITIHELFEYNKLSPSTQLRPGDELMIPATIKKIVSR